MNPFVVPERVLVCRRPQDMRAGIRRLAQVAAASGVGDAASGDLYVFVSRDRRRVKMIRHDGGAWCMWHVAADRGTFSWAFDEAGEPVAEFDRRGLLRLLEGVAGAPAQGAWRVV